MIFNPPTVPPKPPITTVFVHGTHRTADFFGLGFYPLKPYITHKQGLTPLPECDPRFCYTKTMNRIIENSNGHLKPENSYLFCWSGKLSHKDRLEAAQELHNHLTDLYHKDRTAQLLLITHSHGGNVALNLGAIPQKPYCIDCAVLIACPVQEDTKQYANNRYFFKEIYAPYSSWDMFQVLDLQGAYRNRSYVRNLFTNARKPQSTTKKPFFSERTFDKKSPVKHIHVTKKKRPIGHIEFLLPGFTKKLVDIVKTAQKHDYSSGILEYKL